MAATVLLIDDDPGTLDTFRIILSLSHFDVVTADRGSQGIAIALRLDPDLVLADLRLPDLSGVDVLRQLRQLGRSMPFVLMTAFGTTQSVVEAMRLGAADYVEKPISNEHLVELVEQTLQRADRTAVDGSDSAEPHALKRWARAVLGVLDSPTDPKTLSAWARCAAASPGTLRNWCRTAHLGPRRSLVFARLLRAVVRYHTHADPPEDSLDVVDARTLNRLLDLSGTGWASRADAPSLEEFLNRQALIDNRKAIEQIRRAITMPMAAAH